MSMMGIKRSTQAFSKAEQPSGFKPENTNTNGADDFKKAFGDQAVGDVLNKIVDPNWVDPSKKVRAVGNNQLDKDAFLKLMLAQMKNQDPTNPMQNHEMAAQLAQFTSLEQLNNINTQLGQMNKAQAPQANYQALALVGKRVSGDSSKLTRAAGDTKHAFNFELMNDASKVSVTVKDMAGNVVRKMEFGGMKKGQNSIEWNGLDEGGLAARAGDYKFSVDAASSSGGKTYAKTEIGGRITGMNFTPEGPVLLVGSQTLKLSDVKKIEESSPEEAAAATQLSVGQQMLPGGSRMMTLPGMHTHQGAANQLGPTAGQQAPVKGPQKPMSTATASPAVNESENLPSAEEPLPPGNLEDVPMSSELLAQLAKVK